MYKLVCLYFSLEWPIDFLHLFQISWELHLQKQVTHPSSIFDTFCRIVGFLHLYLTVLEVFIVLWTQIPPSKTEYSGMIFFWTLMIFLDIVEAKILITSLPDSIRILQNNICIFFLFLRLVQDCQVRRNQNFVIFFLESKTTRSTAMNIELMHSFFYITR